MSIPLENDNSQYERVVDTISWLLSLESSAEYTIKAMLSQMGIKSFFINLESLDLPSNAIEKLKNLRTIIEVLDGDINQISFEDDQEGAKNGPQRIVPQGH